MTAAAPERVATLADVTGDPFYISVDPYASFKASEPPVCVPLVSVTLNGLEHVLYVHESWQLGTGLLFAVAQISAAGPYADNVTPTVGFKVRDSRELMIGVHTAYEIAVMLMGASVSAIHDMTVSVHFIRKYGWSPDQLAGLYDGMEHVNPIEFLMPDGFADEDQADEDQADEHADKAAAKEHDPYRDWVNGFPPDRTGDDI